MSEQTWSDVFTVDELAAVLDIHAARLAKRYGDYSLAADIVHAAQCIRELADRLDTTRNIGAHLRASLESFGRLP